MARAGAVEWNPITSFSAQLEDKKTSARFLSGADASDLNFLSGAIGNWKCQNGQSNQAVGGR